MINPGQDAGRRRAVGKAPRADRAGELNWDDTPPAGDPDSGNARLSSARESVKSLTNEFQLFCACNEPDEQFELLGRMQQRIKALRDSFSIAELPLWSKFSASVSTFLFATSKKPGFPTFSSFRTMADALDLLRQVVVSGARWNGVNASALTVLIIDEDAAVRRGLRQALQSQGIQVTECEGAAQTPGALRESPFDVIFFGTTMPGLDEFTFTENLRKVAHHRETAVVLVTPLPDYESRCSSLLSETCDFIAQPIAPSEVAVKAFALGLKRRLEGAKNGNGATEPKLAGHKEAAPPTPSVEAQTAPAAEVAALDERVRRAERQAVQAAQARSKLEQELTALAQQLQHAQEKALELEKAQHTLASDLGRSSRRETQLKQESAVLEQQLELLNQTLDQARQDAAQEGERRAKAEQQATRLNHRLQEVIQSEATARQELEQAARDHAEELARVQATLQKEVTARNKAEQARAEVAAAQARLEKQLMDFRLHAQQAHESAATQEQARKLIQAELRGILERQAQLDQQGATLAQQLDRLGQGAKE